MVTKPLISGEILIEVERSRYDELLHKEEQLKLLKKAVENCTPYTSDLIAIKAAFDIKERKGNEE